MSASLRTARMDGTPANGEPREGGKDEALSRRSTLARLFRRCTSMLRRALWLYEAGSKVQHEDGLSEAGFFSQKRPVPTCRRARMVNLLGQTSLGQNGFGNPSTAAAAAAAARRHNAWT